MIISCCAFKTTLRGMVRSVHGTHPLMNQLNCSNLTHEKNKTKGVAVGFYLSEIDTRTDLWKTVPRSQLIKFNNTIHDRTLNLRRSWRPQATKTPTFELSLLERVKSESDPDASWDAFIGCWDHVTHSALQMNSHLGGDSLGGKRWCDDSSQIGGSKQAVDESSLGLTHHVTLPKNRPYKL